MIPRLECQNFKGGPRVRDFRRSLGPPRKKKGARERAGSFSEQRLVMVSLRRAECDMLSREVQVQG